MSLKIFSRQSIDTAETGSGDHENYFAKLDLNEYLIKRGGDLLNGQCETKATRIRAVSNQIMWPNIPKTTLLFSYNEKYYSKGAMDITDFIFYPIIKPQYG